MPTVVLNAYSKAYPLISNRIRASVYLQSSPQALVATIIDAVSGHPERTWSFPGLPRNNYGFLLEEIDGSDNVVANLAKFDVVPGEMEGQLVRDDEQIQVDTTPGFNSNLQTVTFDGTGGKPNYIGWEIVPSELTGRGILVRDHLDYTWNSTTGVFTLTQTGDVLSTGTWWNIHFNPIAEIAGNSYPTLKDFNIRLVTATSTLLTADFGNKVIIEPGSSYIEVTLPNIVTVVAGRPVMIEIGGNTIQCVKFIAGSTINWLRGSIYAMPGESLSIYRFTRSVGNDEWRVSEADGNFKTVGQSVSDDSEIADVINKQLLDGSSKSKFTFARIYNQFVLNLPLAQVVNYDDWATGNNKYFFSFANSANPSFANEFHFPDRRGITERNTSTGTKPGDYNGFQSVFHKHEQTVGTLPSTIFGKAPTNKTHGTYQGTGFGLDDLTGGMTDTDGNVLAEVGDEVLVKNYLNNKYIVI